jgi:GNAT superfamily N-acetyltransferase
LLDNKIEGVYIHPDHQRQGYGTRIMQALEEQARISNIHKITLSSHTVSKAFYDALGYRILEERTFTVGTDTQFRYYIMEKDI